MSYIKEYQSNTGNRYNIEIDVAIEFGEGVYLEVFEAFPITNGEVGEYSIGPENADYDEIELWCEQWVSDNAMQVEEDSRGDVIDAYYDAYKDEVIYGN